MQLKYLCEVIRNVFSLSFIRAISSTFGYYIHEHVVWRRKINLKKNTRIHATASIRNAQNVYVGENSHINHNCCLWCGEYSKIILGDNLLMGPGVKMFTMNHGIANDAIMNTQDRIENDIIIGNDCWVGANCVILRGVHIADGCVIAAGAVVTKSINEPYSIVGGVPGKIIGNRK